MKEVHDMAKNDEKYAYLNRLNTEQLEELLRIWRWQSQGMRTWFFISWR